MAANGRRRLTHPPQFSFTLDDAGRDVATGEFAEGAAADEESETDGEEVCSDQASETEGSSDDSGGDTTDDDLEGDDFAPADHEPVLPDCPTGSLEGMRIYHRGMWGGSRGMCCGKCR